MKQYLISGFLHFEDLSHRPYVGYAALQPSEVMDRDTVRTVQHLLLEEAQSFSAQQGLPLPAGFRAHSFQPYESVDPTPAAFSKEQVASLARAAQHDTLLGQLKELRAVLRKLGWEVKNGVVPSAIRLLANQVALNEAVQLNECSVIMPPVDSPIMIEIAPGVLLKASRPAHAEARGDQLVFNLETHGQFVGRPRWTHP